MYAITKSRTGRNAAAATVYTVADLDTHGMGFRREFAASGGEQVFPSAAEAEAVAETKQRRADAAWHEEWGSGLWQ